MGCLRLPDQRRLWGMRVHTPSWDSWNRDRFR